MGLTRVFDCRTLPRYITKSILIVPYMSRGEKKGLPIPCFKGSECPHFHLEIYVTRAHFHIMEQEVSQRRI